MTAREQDLVDALIEHSLGFIEKRRCNVDFHRVSSCFFFEYIGYGAIMQSFSQLFSENVIFRFFIQKMQDRTGGQEKYML